MSTQAYCVTILCEYTKINTLGYLIYFCRIFCFTVFKLLQVQMYLNYYNNNYYKKHVFQVALLTYYTVCDLAFYCPAI